MYESARAMLPLTALYVFNAFRVSMSMSTILAAPVLIVFAPFRAVVSAALRMLIRLLTTLRSPQRYARLCSF